MPNNLAVFRQIAIYTWACSFSTLLGGAAESVADSAADHSLHGAGRAVLTEDDLTYLPAHSFAGLAGLPMGAINGSVRGGRN